MHNQRNYQQVTLHSSTTSVFYFANCLLDLFFLWDSNFVTVEISIRERENASPYPELIDSPAMKDQLVTEFIMNGHLLFTCLFKSFPGETWFTNEKKTGTGGGL